MTLLYGVFDKEESRYILYADEFTDADLFVRERLLGNRLEIDMIDLRISRKEVIRRNVREEDF